MICLLLYCFCRINNVYIIDSLYIELRYCSTQTLLLPIHLPILLPIHLRIHLPIC